MIQECRMMQEEIVKLRRDLHRIPELGCVLPETCAYVEARLKELGIPCRQIAENGGILAEIDTGKPGKTLLFRADMDALPVPEETGLPFSSEREGRMHACGHDAHTAMLLAAAKVILKHREKLSGTVRLLFQTGEEVMDGAEMAIREGALEPRPDAVFGMHIGTIMGAEIPAGTVVAAPGCVMASCDRFLIRIKGVGCHGSTPEKGVDPITVGSHIVTGLQELIARECPGRDARVLTVCRFTAGHTWNVIPDTAELEGTVRAVSDAVRQQILERIREIAQGIARTYRAEAEVEMALGSAPVINNPEMAELAAQAAAAAVGADHVMTQIAGPTMIAEDFASYLQRVPGAFLFLSSSNPAKGTDRPHHSSRFDIDEDVLWEGAAVFASIAKRYLGAK